MRYNKHTAMIRMQEKENAGMAELADALDSGSSEGNFMKVQVLLPAPNRNNPNLILMDYGFGFSVYIGDPA